MTGCLAEDELLDLAHGKRRLDDAPALEAHLADCAMCSGLLSTLLAGTPDEPQRHRGGTTLGPYRLEELIGAGAMGEVYRAHDPRLHRDVAVKVLPRRLADSPDRIRRLEAEARAAAKIAHPNVVTVYDIGTDDGVPYIVGELVAGETLRSSIERNAIAREQAHELVLQLVRGLAAAHARGVVHRDLKPANLIVRDGTLKILDFGLAKLAGDRDVDETEPGTLLGTSGYLAPEQARGEPADARSDIFAVGAIYYELLAGRRAFEGATFAERLSAVLRDTPPALDDPVWPIVLRCIEKDPSKRFQSAADLAWALERRDGLRARSQPPRRPPAISRRTFLATAAATGAGGLVLGRMLAPARSQRLAQPAFAQLTFRQGRVSRARFTPDGGNVLYSAAWDDAPMAIYSARLQGGGTRALELPSAQLLAVSSRGQLAISLGHRYLQSFYQEGQLALAPLEGGEPRALGVAVQDADFTPDGSVLAVVRRAGATFRLECPLDHVLFEANWLSYPRVSPDGTYVACFAHDSMHDDAGTIVIVPRAGGAARTVRGEWSSIDGLAWARHGRALWISASREGGNNSVRTVALDGRELAHYPTAGRVRVHDVSIGGTVAITHVSGRLHLVGKPPGAARELELGLSDVSLVGAMTPDGSSIAFSEFGDVNTANGAYLRPSDGGAAVQLGAGTPCDISRERGVLCTLGSRLAVYPMTAGARRMIDVGLARIRWARWCAGDAMLVAGATGARPPRLWRFDRTLSPLTDEGVVAYACVGPEGRRAAMIVEDRLLVVDIGTATTQTVPGTFVDTLVCGWSSDGAGVLVRSSTLPIEIRRVELATGATSSARRIAPPPVGLRSVSAVVTSLDAEAYAYSYGQELSRLYSMTTTDPTSSQ